MTLPAEAMSHTVSLVAANTTFKNPSHHLRSLKEGKLK